MKSLRRYGVVGLMAAMVLAALVWQTAPVRGQETISAQIRLQLNILNKLLVGLRTITSTLDQDYTQLFSSGTGANQGNAMWQSQRTLGASATEALDLNGSLTDDFGQSIACTALKALLVKAAVANTNNVLVGGGATTLTSMTTVGVLQEGLVVRPGGVLLWTFPDATGAAVTATSADKLQVANSGGSTSVTYDIVAICEE